jgi:hypothetical protein
MTSSTTKSWRLPMAKTITFEEARKAVPVSKEKPLYWSGPFPIPLIEERVHIFMNGFGDGVVLGYKEAEGYLGIVVHLYDPPDWYIRNCDGVNEPATFYGADLIDYSGKEVS